MNADVEQMSPARRALVVAVFGTVCALIFGFLWVNSGGKVPLVNTGGYTVEVDVPKVANVVYFSDVMVAGVKVGKVTEVTEQGDHARVQMKLDSDVAPLHEGAVVQVRAKSLIEESFLEITDGAGAQVKSGSLLSKGSGRSATQLNDVLETLDKPTRKSLRSTLLSLGQATDDGKAAYKAAAQGLGDLGREGVTVLDAIAAQSGDLSRLTRNSSRVLAALSTRRGQITELVANAQTLAETTAGQDGEIEAVLKSLPPLMASARAGSDDLTAIGNALFPVATNLDAAAPALSRAVKELPQTTTDLRATLPALTQVLDRAPATLDKTPTFADQVTGLVPSAKQVMSDVNPMLGYLEPYGKDIAAFFTNFSGTLLNRDVNGHMFRIMLTVNNRSLRQYPVALPLGADNGNNALPAPGSLDSIGPYSDTYPRVTRERVG